MESKGRLQSLSWGLGFGEWRYMHQRDVMVDKELWS